MSSVEVRGAVKSYGSGNNKSIVLNKLNLTVKPGIIFGLIGSSGCGKTTLLSCILGMIQLDDGSIRVLGHKNKRGRIGHRVGYMPQETALVGELTVKETIFYFGNIFEMNVKVLKERFEVIRDVLELPHEDLRIEKCSGGEKRRISFAAAIIHSPDLLILDEPTVGLDPVLREKIWNFLWTETRNSQLSVIITTHYTMEAQKADRVGLMRSGVLLAEDSPSIILSRCQQTNLDDAFVRLCSESTTNSTKLFEVDNEIKDITLEEMNFKDKPRGKLFRWQIVREMTKKHFRKYTRQPALLASTLLLPAIQLFMLYWLFSDSITYRIAVLNDEINYDDCFNASYKLATADDDDVCTLKNSSCFLLNSLSQSSYLMFPMSFDEGFSLWQRGDVVAFLYIKENFSERINKFMESNKKFPDPTQITRDVIDTFIDGSTRLLGPAFKKKLIEAHNQLIRGSLETCNHSSKFMNSPIVFEKPIFGGDFNSREFLAHSLITTFCFFVASCLTITPFITDRREGFWNRTLLAGVRFQEMLIAQTFAYTTVIAVINIEAVVYASFVYNTTNVGSLITLYFLLLVMGWCAIFFGMLLSTICANLIAANIAMFTFVLSLCIMCGLFFPIETMREIFQIIAKCLPFTFPAEAVRAIMVKKFRLSHAIVQEGFAIAFGWTLVIIILVILALKIRKFSRNT